ncbi:glycoside hydrolase family 3 N-terminal domain-containing protein [Streptacidiphilus albus]|uniref:glycoside hydrolase family 3 N-terminal domain-containing protein n=1 Tax=Streptacidiphilus albus TaxID=105425 RepID=UPI00054BC95B|nr:glycoside hydrolase family 3 N-terminal domain-containing protein [Streptacidiphilus albus]
MRAGLRGSLRNGVVAVCAVALIAACTSGHSSSSHQAGASATPARSTPASASTSTSASASTSASRTPTAAAGDCTTAARLAAWPTRRLALLTVAVPVAETSPQDVTSEVEAGVGGVVLFGTSAPSSLGSRLAALRERVPGRIGLLVMTDEEGGDIQRMANLVGSLPWPAWMGTHWSPAEIQQAVTEVAKRMSAEGVNMDLAPVVDVDGRDEPPSDSNPDGWRSFSGSTAVVTRDALAYMAGLRAGGVIPVLKHFPGLGGSSYNSDIAPAHTVPWPVVQRVGLPPFAAAIAAGAPAVMASNDTVPGFAAYPTGLSPTQLGVLRNTLHFGGLVITDSLSAGAISGAGFTIPQAAVQAISAGSDMVMFGLMSNESGETNAIADAIVSAVADGHLPRTRLVDAAAAVLAVRHEDLCPA